MRPWSWSRDHGLGLETKNCSLDVVVWTCSLGLEELGFEELGLSFEELGLEELGLDLGLEVNVIVLCLGLAVLVLMKNLPYHLACLICSGKLGVDSVSNHQVSRNTASPNGNIFTSQFGTSAAGTPLRQTISIKLSSQSSTAAALRGSNAVNLLADADANDNDETNSSPRRTDATSSTDSSVSRTLVTFIHCISLIFSSSTDYAPSLSLPPAILFHRCSLELLSSFLSVLSPRTLGPLSPNFATCSVVTQIGKIQSEIWVASSPPPPQNLAAQKYRNFGAFLDNFAT